MNQSYKVFINENESSNPEVDLACMREERVYAFETMMVKYGKVFRLKEHIERLFESLRTIGSPVPENQNDFKRNIEKIAKKISNGERIFLRLSLIQDKNVFIGFRRSYPDWIYEKGVDVKTASTQKNHSNAIPPEAKTGQFLNGILGFLESSAAFETLFLDRSGYVKESSSGNIFMIKKGILKTPAHQGILNGVTRRFVIECAQKEGISVEEVCMTRHDIWNSEEAFLTNTSGGMVPLRFLDGRQIGEKVPGEITFRLMKRFEEELEKELCLKSNAL